MIYNSQGQPTSVRGSPKDVLKTSVPDSHQIGLYIRVGFKSSALV